MHGRQFHIKVIARNSAIIIESDGVKSEVFRPVVLSGRIRLINPVKTLFTFDEENNNVRNVLKEITNLKTKPVLQTINTNMSTKNVNNNILQSKDASKQKQSNKGNRNIGNSENMTPLPSKKPAVENYTIKTPLRSKRRSNLFGVSPGSVVNWRKCITPQRTYSKRPFRKIQTPKSNKIHRGTYDKRKATQGFISDTIVEVKKIKTKIDKKVIISPKTFKQHLKDYSDITRQKRDYLFPYIGVKYHTAKYRSRELILQPSRSRCISENLEKLFLTKCTRKIAAVERDYKKFPLPLEPLEIQTETNSTHGTIALSP